LELEELEFQEFSRCGKRYQVLPSVGDKLSRGVVLSQSTIHLVALYFSRNHE